MNEASDPQKSEEAAFFFTWDCSILRELYPATTPWWVVLLAWLDGAVLRGPKKLKVAVMAAVFFEAFTSPQNATCL